MLPITARYQFPHIASRLPDALSVRRRLRRSMAMGMIVACFLFSASCSNSNALDCTGDGSVAGSFSEINTGTLKFAHGVAWGNPVQGYRVLFTEDPVFADALRASPNPAEESELIARVLGELVIGYEFSADGVYRQHLSMGTSTSSGSSGADLGRISIDDQGCARGDIHVDHYGDGSFALPLLRPNPAAGDIEMDDRPESVPRINTTATDDPLAAWRTAYSRLSDLHPTSALQAIGFSASVAARMAPDPRAQAALRRMRDQCPSPASAELDEYGDVVGIAWPHAGVMLGSTADAAFTGDGAVIENCYVTTRNDQSVEQCWPLISDCSKGK